MGAIVVKQPGKTFPGKGIAMKAGIEEATKRNADIILFLDADIRNLTPEWVDILVENGVKYDMVRGFYLTPKRRCSYKVDRQANA